MKEYWLYTRTETRTSFQLVVMRTRQDLGPLQNEVSTHVCVCMHMYVTMFISRMEANIPLGQRQTSTGVITGEFKIVFPSLFFAKYSNVCSVNWNNGA